MRTISTRDRTAERKAGPFAPKQPEWRGRRSATKASIPLISDACKVNFRFDGVPNICGISCYKTVCCRPDLAPRLIPGEKLHSQAADGHSTIVLTGPLKPNTLVSISSQELG